MLHILRTQKPCLLLRLLHSQLSIQAFSLYFLSLGFSLSVPCYETLGRSFDSIGVCFLSLMASSSSSSAIVIPKLVFLSPQLTPRRCFSLSRNSPSRLSLARNRGCDFSLRSRISAVKEDGGVVVEERERKLIESGNGAASANGNGYSLNGSVVESYSNGGAASVVETGDGAANGSLVEYVNGNGVAAPAVEVATEVQDAEVKEVGRKKRIEEIGKEDAWFKQSGAQNVEVSVAPGGRWSRFKRYSTIQRTLEIWGFVLTFIFKAWLNNQKFTYRGGITEEKKVLKRKALAKWLKESILRLGPTFIKIGQQFSTRVDILAQEYVDQLSELQVTNHWPFLALEVWMLASNMFPITL